MDRPSPLASWNGTFMPLSEVRVSVLDRAFLFGDAIYEALRVYEGRPFLLDEHMARLRRSLDQIRIEADVERIGRRIFDLLERQPVRDGLIYLQVTRGEAPRTHYFPANPIEPNELIYVSSLEDDPHAPSRKTGVGVITFDDLRWKRCDIKSVNLLGNCMAAQAAREAGCAEAILVAADGTITEGSHTSVFGVRDGAVMTAPLARNILPGITRNLVVQLANRVGIAIREEPLSRDRLPEVDEL
ncbi:MAG: aminotransferase class IV, partial [Maioricimonas sp. JB049]